jgi:MFS family permease
MDSKDKHRFYLSIFFFLSGVGFSSWTSRIPTITENFRLDEAELGTILVFMPISSLMGLPVSGWLVSRFNSRKPLTIAFSLTSIALACIGFSSSTTMLIASLCFFAFSMRIFNISVNTQAITVQKLFERKINGSFHGLWSAGGIVGVGITTLMVMLDVPMHIHLLIIAVIAVLAALFSYGKLIRNDRAPSGNKLKLTKPDPYIVYLGLLVFLAAIVEGGMFDWSGMYFKKVVNVPIFTLGYLIFMIFMSLSRFASDRIIEMVGMPRTYILSALFIFTGITLAVIFPYFWTSLVGFCLVGFGTAAVIPMTYLLAGTSKKYSPGMAISIIATYGIVGMFIGPPMIGYIAHAFNLKVSFIAFALAGILLIPISQMFFRYKESVVTAPKSA